MVTSTYGIADFRLDVMELYKKCGLKGMSFSFIITDSQIVDRQMLVYLNDMLASGNIPDLFAAVCPMLEGRRGVVRGLSFL